MILIVNSGPLTIIMNSSASLIINYRLFFLFVCFIDNNKLRKIRDFDKIKKEERHTLTKILKTNKYGSKYPFYFNAQKWLRKNID